MNEKLIVAANGIPNQARIHKAEILQRIARGERITDIGRSLGYAGHSQISQTLSRDPEYRNALMESAWAKLETREHELECAIEQTDITRQRELLSHARWMAERLNRDQFAPKPDISISVNTLVALDTALANAATGLLDQLRTVSSQQQSAATSLALPPVAGDDDVSA